MNFSEETMSALANNDSTWAAGIFKYADSIVRFQANPNDAEPISAWATDNDIPGRISDIKFFVNQFYANLTTILDLVGKLVARRGLTEKQWNFLNLLGDKTFHLDTHKFITDLTEKMTRIANDKKNSDPVPDHGQKSTIVGEVITIKRDVSSLFGMCDKMLVKSDDGYRIYGTIPKAIRKDVRQGSRIRFIGTLIRSDDDEYFGFFNHPSAAILQCDE